MPYYRVLDDAIVMDSDAFSGSTSASIQEIIDEAISNGLPLFVRPGTYEAYNLSVYGPVTVHGVPGLVTFRMAAGASSLIYFGAFTVAEFHGITFDGDNVAFSDDSVLQPAQGLINMRRDSGTIDSKAIFDKCSFMNSTQCGIGVNGCRLLVTDCTFRSCSQKSIGVIHTDELTVRNCRLEDQDWAIHCSPDASTNVLIEGNLLRRCRRNGIAFEPSGSSKINRDITVRDNKISKLESSDTWAVSRTYLPSTGAEGNGVLAYLCENVVVEGNQIEDCEFSAMRANVTSQLTVSGNICRGSGETALYVETVGISVGEFGATVSGNVIYGGSSGIAVVNYNYDGRFATVTGNIVRNIESRTITYSGGSYETTGIGIAVEADTTVSGNTIQNAPVGLSLGTNEYTSDLAATGNVIRETRVGIEVSDNPPREILVSSNLIAGYTEAAIKASVYTGGKPPSYTVGNELAPPNRGSAAEGNVHMIGNVHRETL